jgi:hypothetical protein
MSPKEVAMKIADRILELQEETIKNQQGWGYICVRNFAANYN